MKETFVGKCYFPGFDPATYTDPVLEECYRITVGRGFPVPSLVPIRNPRGCSR